jgi:ABC-2 type transport system permease protein
MYPLFIKEIKSFLSSIIGYASIIVFLISTGVFLWVFPGNNNIIEMGNSSLVVFFNIAPSILMFLIPAFTMKLFAEENRAGTIEILMTKPISIFKIVVAKFLAGSFLIILTLAPTIVYYVSVYYMGNPTGNIDHASTIGSYLGLILLGMTFVSIGTFASSLSSNQVIAFLIGLFLCFIFYLGFTFIASIFGNPLDYYMLKLSMIEHFTSIKRGVIDSRDLVYFLSIILFFLVSTKTVIQHKI